MGDIKIEATTQPNTVEIEDRQVFIHSGHEFHRDVLFWIHETFPHVFRHLSQSFHDEIMAWVQANTTGIYMADLDPQQQGTIWFADAADAQAYEAQFSSNPRFW